MITGLDHLVIPVTDLEAAVRFYQATLGLEAIRSAEGRIALAVGSQKINLHSLETDIHPRAAAPRSGGADFCLITDRPLTETIDRLARNGIDLIAGPVKRTGALGPMRSIYFRDPDGNLVEVAKYE